MDAERRSELRSSFVAGRGRQALTEAIAATDPGPTWVAKIGDAEIDLPTSVLPTLIDLLADVAEGRAVTVAPADIPLGTTEAARLLGVSRTWLVELIERGDLPAEMVGTKRRVPLGAAVAHRREQSERLRAAAAALGEALDRGDDEPVDLAERLVASGRAGARAAGRSAAKATKPTTTKTRAVGGS